MFLAMAGVPALFIGLIWSWLFYSPNTFPSAIWVDVLVLAVFIPMMSLVNYFWMISVPMPVSRLGVSPAGLVIDFAAGPMSVPWSRVLLSGPGFYVIPEKLGPALAYRVTPYQAIRLAYLRPSPA
jgi:hypothetical protein